MNKNLKFVMDESSSRRIDVTFTNNVDITDPNSSRRFSGWEEQCILDCEVDTSSETVYMNERRNFDQKLWLAFQNTASAMAQLYKDKTENNEDLWTAFQNAAEITTNLYKESIDGYKRVAELALQCGYQRRNKEIMSWIKKKRKLVRREEVVGYMCGRSPPHKPSRANNSNPRGASINSSPDPSGNQLQIFQEAVLMNGLNGAMAGISFGGDASLRRTSSPARSCQHGIHPDLTNFICDETRRRTEGTSSSASRKRHTSTYDLKPSSPKRRK